MSDIEYIYKICYTYHLPKCVLDRILEDCKLHNGIRNYTVEKWFYDEAEPLVITYNDGHTVVY